MAQLGLPELHLVLKDFEGEKKTLLESLLTGRAYAEKFRKLRLGIEALPQILTGTALAEELSAADESHDALGSSIWFYCEACVRHQNLPPATRDAAERIREALVPELAELRRPYAVEAENALARLDRLDELQDDLALFPVPGGGSLADWVAAFLEQGKRIDQLLAQRGDLQVGSSRRKVSLLRSEIMGMLSRLREAVRDEVRDNPQFGPDVEARLFGYYDELARLRGERRKPKPATGPIDAVAPPA